MEGAERLAELYARLDRRGRASLLDFAEYLAARACAEPPALRVEPRPAEESVVQAIRRLNRSYPMLKRRRLMPKVERLMAQHMVDGRPAAAVIEELEAFYAAEYRLADGD